MTLTDHFKQALNSTKAQIHQGPSVTTSASQIGVGPQMVHPQPAPTIVQEPRISHTANPSFGAANNVTYPSEQLVGIMSNEPTFWCKYGNTILIISMALVVVIVLGIYWWRRKGCSDEEEKILNPRRGRSRNTQYTREPFIQPPPQPSNGSNMPPNHQRPPPPPVPQQTPPPSQYLNRQGGDSLKDQEQPMSLRGANMANPAFTSASHERPQPTRGVSNLKDVHNQPQQFPQPPQNLQQQQQQPQSQQQPQLYTNPEVNYPVHQQFTPNPSTNSPPLNPPVQVQQQQQFQQVPQSPQQFQQPQQVPPQQFQQVPQSPQQFQQVPQSPQQFQQPQQVPQSLQQPQQVVSLPQSPEQNPPSPQDPQSQQDPNFTPLP